MKEKSPVTLFWFRRDLRLNDNAGLYHALRQGNPVLPVFIFDSGILTDLVNRSDARVNFIYDTLQKLSGTLAGLGSGIIIRYGRPLQVWEELIKEYPVSAVFANHDYEPYAISRDHEVQKLLNGNGIHFDTYKDHVIFERDEIMTDTGSPYKVYTPYKNKWLLKLNDFYLKAYPTEKYFNRFYKTDPLKFPSLREIGFEKSDRIIPSETVSQGIIKNYHAQRDFPALDATSRLGIHFRFGTISIREKAAKAAKLNQVWLNELVWRDFFIQLLYHYPHVVSDHFNARFKKVDWRHDPDDFNKWCEGKTGYPLVDAGIRELNATGYMHNRVRMVVASFLTKHLLIDWRMGEAYFAEKLLDFELASNNGNWQWCAGTGADAQPYFRIFNPVAQQQKFDSDFVYIRKWVPEFGTPEYPLPMIEHKTAVARAKTAFLVLGQ